MDLFSKMVQYILHRGALRNPIVREFLTNFGKQNINIKIEGSHCWLKKSRYRYIYSVYIYIYVWSSNVIDRPAQDLVGQEPSQSGRRTKLLFELTI